MSEVEESWDHHQSLAVGEAFDDLDLRNLIDHEAHEKSRDEEFEIAGKAWHGRRRVSDQTPGSGSRPPEALCSSLAIRYTLDPGPDITFSRSFAEKM